MIRCRWLHDELDMLFKVNSHVHSDVDIQWIFDDDARWHQLFIQESTKTRIVFTVAIARRLEGLRKVVDQTPEKKIYNGRSSWNKTYVMNAILFLTPLCMVVAINGFSSLFLSYFLPLYLACGTQLKGYVKNEIDQ